MTSSLRACLAAESWKRLWPDGAPVSGRPKKAAESKSKNILTFEDFAKQSFKVSETYANQALAILNYSPDLLEDAKQDLTGTYKTYQGRVKTPANDSSAADEAQMGKARLGVDPRPPHHGNPIF